MALSRGTSRLYCSTVMPGMSKVMPKAMAVPLPSVLLVVRWHRRRHRIVDRFPPLLGPLRRRLATV
jgi:hypothetical protein